MKVAIITLPLISNFGGILQNFALQQVLKDLGHEPTTIDIDLSPSPLRYLIRCIHVFIANKGRFVKPDSYGRNEKVASFIRSNINMTPRVKNYLDKKLDNSEYDAYIVGSDQVWRYSCSKPVIKDVYLRFTERRQCKRIAYAISFGSSTWNYPSYITKSCKNLITKFDGVSVRERSAVDLCSQYLDITPTLVLDPTLLISSDIYLNLCSHIPVRRNCLVAYLLDNDETKEKLVRKYASLLSLECVFLTEQRDGGITVEEWLAYFRDAKFVITDSFHGTVFSIIFEHDFVAIINPKRGSDRFTSLLGQFSLESRLIDNINSEIIQTKINWNNVKERKNELKNYSIKYLTDNLRK